MYIISILAVVILVKLLTVGSGIFWPLDYFTLLLMVLFNFTLLTSAGFLKDFNNALRLNILNKKRQESVQELKRSLESVTLVIKTTLTSSIFIFFFQSAQLLCTTDLSEESASIGEAIMSGISAFVYSSAIILVLLPIESVLKLKLWNAQKAQEILCEQRSLDSQDTQDTNEE